MGNGLCQNLAHCEYLVPRGGGLKGGEEEGRGEVNGKNTLRFLHWRQHERTGNMEQY